MNEFGGVSAIFLINMEKATEKRTGKRKVWDVCSALRMMILSLMFIVWNRMNLGLTYHRFTREDYEELSR